MKTEISRDSHQPEKRYSGVYQQQGRMLVDADWNELVEILKARVDEALKDVVGNDASRVGGTPRHRALTITKPTPADALTLNPGVVYVDGLRGVIPGVDAVAYGDQPDFPKPPPLAENCTVYADLWERTVTQLMDARLRDVGLHGADTCTRKQAVVQLKWAPAGVDPEQSSLNPRRGDAPLSLTLQRKTSKKDPCDPCADQLDIDSRVGNFLFRVEVHDVVGPADSPTGLTLKWSSENGAEQTIAKAEAELPEGFVDSAWVYEFFDENSERHLGVHLADSGWNPIRGVLTEISSPLHPYEVPGSLGGEKLPVLLRRWDGYCELDLAGADPLVRGADRGVTLSTGSATDSHGHLGLSGGKLEIVLNNILLKLDLDSKSLVAGDYWLVDVREVSHDPDDEKTSILLDKALPQGIEHRYLTLGTVSGNALEDNPERDRKFAFPPLTEMTRIFSAGGDGQEIMPGEALPQPLRVGVGNGEWPVEGASVRFQIDPGAGGGELSPIGSAVTGTSVIAVTDADGIAACTWTPESDIESTYRVKATLVDPDDPGTDFSPPVYFYANLVTADQVAYQAGCDGDGEPENTVHWLLANDAAVGLELGDDEYYTVAEVLDALLCKLKAKHLPYDANNLARWQDVNEEEGGSKPETVQQAIDALLENLHSEDIKYKPTCVADTPPTVRSLLGIPGNTASRVSEVLDELLCNFNATDLPVDRSDLCGYLEGLSGSEQVETVQDALNALCRRGQGGGCCDITISPGDDLVQRLENEIPPAADVNICIRPGEYVLQRPVLLKGLGHVSVQGCGFGTVIRAPESESAIIIEECKRAVVQNLSAFSNRLGDKAGSEFDHLNGALTVRHVDDVVVQHVFLKCAHGGRKQGSCLTVASESGSNSVRVSDCRLEPGHQQVGLLLINGQRAWIENNDIRVRPKQAKTPLSAYIRDKDYRLSIRKIIMADAIVVPQDAVADKKRNVQVEYEGRLLRFRTEPSLAPAWNKFFSGSRLPRNLNDRDLLREVKGRADTVLVTLAEDNGGPRGGTRGGTRGGVPSAFATWFKELANSLPAIGSQGIVCGGSVANDLQVRGNSVHGFRQGIHVGLSDGGDSQTLSAGRVLIRDNMVVNFLSAQVLGERHGIFVGNFDTLHIEDNQLRLRKFPAGLEADLEGIRIYGIFGEMLQVRGNRLRDHGPAIFARAVNPSLPKVQLWQVENNLLLGGKTGDPDLEPASKFIQQNNPR